MVYYDTTPKSSILNRFTKDTNIIDIDIPFDIDIFSSQFLIALSYTIIACTFIKYNNIRCKAYCDFSNWNYLSDSGIWNAATDQCFLV